MASNKKPNKFGTFIRDYLITSYVHDFPKFTCILRCYLTSKLDLYFK